MYQFVESIKFINNTYYNLEYHQARFGNTRSIHFPGGKQISLEEVLKPPAGLLSNKLYKCRVIYGETIFDVTYEIYIPKLINQYYLVVCPGEFEYSHKSVVRTFFDEARNKIKNDEDFIYVKKGLITDTSYANLVFTDGIGYFTPANPLLKGTKRAYYLKTGIIREEEIQLRDISKFKSFFTINAMIDLGITSAFSCDKLLLSHIHLKI